MEIKTFTSVNGLELIAKSKKSAIIFELGEVQEDKYKFEFVLRSDDFKELYEYLQCEVNKCWTGIILKEADSLSSDYCEYYDKELDSEGSLYFIKNGLRIDRPTLDSKRLYKFDKRKIQSFLYDFEEKLE